MPPQQHPLEEMGSALADWIEDVSDELAEALRDGGRAPFEARLTKLQQLAYYDVEFFLPSGQPNVQGRQAELQRLGPQQYANAMRAVLKWRETQTAPDEDEGDEGDEHTGGDDDTSEPGSPAPVAQRGY